MRSRALPQEDEMTDLEKVKAILDKPRDPRETLDEIGRLCRGEIETPAPSTATVEGGDVPKRKRMRR